MSNDIIVMSERADIFTRALTDRFGAERLFWKTRKPVGTPHWNFQNSEVEVAPHGATPPDGAVIVTQTESDFLFQGPGGMVVKVKTTPPFDLFYAKNKDRARPAMFVANVEVDLSIYCSYSAASEDVILSASSSIPLPEEVHTYNALLEHIRALKKVLKACHFNEVNYPSPINVDEPVDDAPWIERFPANRGNSSIWWAGIYWENDFTLERKKAAPFVAALARLLDTPLASRFANEPREHRHYHNYTGT